jgi:hypothetical protein
MFCILVANPSNSCTWNGFFSGSAEWVSGYPGPNGTTNSSFDCFPRCTPTRPRHIRSRTWPAFVHDFSASVAPKQVLTTVLRLSRRPQVSPASVSSQRGNPMFALGSNPLRIRPSTRRVVQPFGFQRTEFLNTLTVRNPNPSRTRHGTDTTLQNLLLLTGSGTLWRRPHALGTFWWAMSWISR